MARRNDLKLRKTTGGFEREFARIYLDEQYRGF